jgi:hypothetical protein
MLRAVDVLAASTIDQPVSESYAGLCRINTDAVVIAYGQTPAAVLFALNVGASASATG